MKTGSRTGLCWTSRVRARQERAVLALLAFVSAFLGVPGWAATVAGVEVSGERVVLRFDGAVSRASAFVLDGPQWNTVYARAHKLPCRAVPKGG